jgi:UrcA family protein
MALTAIAALPATATHAESTQIKRSETVHYGDLDLANQPGAVTLYRRLHLAATDVCSLPSEGRYPSGADYQRCVEQAMGDAVASVDQPVLTTYAQSRGVAVTSRQGGRPN